MPVLDLDLSKDAVPDEEFVQDKTETIARLEGASFGVSERSGKPSYTCIFSLPDFPNAPSIFHYISIPTEEEMTSDDPRLLKSRMSKLRRLREFYEMIDMDFSNGKVDTDAVSAHVKNTKPEFSVIVGYTPQQTDEETGDTYPERNSIRRFLGR